MVTCYSWIMDVRLHLAVIVSLIAFVLGQDHPTATPEPSWRMGRLALLHPESGPPPLPVVIRFDDRVQALPAPEVPADQP